MAKNPIDNRTLLDIHRIDTDFITVCSNFLNPFCGVLKCISFRHEWWLEQKIRFGTQTVSLQGIYRPFPSLCSKPFVAMKFQYFIIICLKPDGYSTAWVFFCHPGNLLFMAKVGLSFDNQMLAHRSGFSQHGFLPIDWVLLVFKECARGVDFDHVTAFEIVQLILGSQPLCMQVETGDIVANIIEITAEGTP